MGRGSLFVVAGAMALQSGWKAVAWAAMEEQGPQAGGHQLPLLRSYGGAAYGEGERVPEFSGCGSWSGWDSRQTGYGQGGPEDGETA